LVFENGHFKNVQNGKSEKSLEKDPLKSDLSRKCCNFQKNEKKNCYCNFFENNLKFFSISIIWNLWNKKNLQKNFLDFFAKIVTLNAI
jgi:hypothetical protein